LARRGASVTSGYSAQKSNGANLGFEEKMARLTRKLEEQFTESAMLEAAIRRNLRELGYEL